MAYLEVGCIQWQCVTPESNQAHWVL